MLRRLVARPIVVVAVLLGAFFVLQSLIPLRTAVQIGADEGFELAKATLCLKGYKLYSEVWNDQPPLHTFLITQVLKYLTPSVLGPRLVSVGFATLLLASVFAMALHSGVGVSPARVDGESISRWRQAGRAVPLQQAGSALALWTAALSTVLLMAAPGFLELSSSSMMEIPALAPAVARLCVLLVGCQN